jgi:predicted GNAT family acetyltransferase
MLLDNPIWHSLNFLHSHLATGTPLAKRYPTEVTKAVAIADHSKAAFQDLAQIVAVHETVRLLQVRLPSELSGWQIQHREEVVQMVCGSPGPKLEPALPLSSLTTADVPDMMSLVELTRPGPFLRRTIETGRYVGFRWKGQLVAMAGGRFAVPGYREISSVCTHPDYQGRGYARQLVSHLVNDNFQRGYTPFLHVRVENARARALYETLNSRQRCTMSLLFFSH